MAHGVMLIKRNAENVITQITRLSHLFPGEEIRPGWIEVPADSDFDIGGIWDGRTYTPPPPRPKVLNKLDFARLFTPEQFLAIESVLPTQPGLRYFFRLLEFADTVNLGHPDTLAALEVLKAANLLTQEDVDRIKLGQKPAKI